MRRPAVDTRDKRRDAVGKAVREQHVSDLPVVLNRVTPMDESLTISPDSRVVFRRSNRDEGNLHLIHIWSLGYVYHESENGLSLTTRRISRQETVTEREGKFPLLVTHDNHAVPGPAPAPGSLYWELPQTGAGPEKTCPMNTMCTR